MNHVIVLNKGIGNGTCCFVLLINGGTYVKQYKNLNIKKALSEWIDELKTVDNDIYDCLLTVESAPQNDWNIIINDNLSLKIGKIKGVLVCASKNKYKMDLSYITL